MKRVLGYLIPPAIGVLFSAVAYQVGFPGMIFFAVVLFGYGAVYVISEGDFIPLTAFVGYILGLIVVSGALVS